MSNNTQPLNNINLDETSACINHSEKKENIFPLLKYTLIGMLFGIVLLKLKSYPGLEYKKCFYSKAFICMA